MPDIDNPIYKRLCILKDLANLKYTNNLATECDVNRHTLYAAERGIKPISKNVAKKIAYYLSINKGIDCSIDWLLEGKGPPPKKIINSNDFPFMFNVDLEAAAEEQNILKETSLLESHTKNLIIVSIKDDTMLPFYGPGDYVAGEIINKLEEKDYGLCIAKTLNDLTLVRHVVSLGLKRFSLKATNIHTKCLNLNIENIQLKYVAPIIWHRKRSYLNK